MAIGDIVKVWPRHVYVRVQGEFELATSGAPVEQFSFGVRLGTVTDMNGGSDGEAPTGVYDQNVLDTYLSTIVVPATRTLFGSPYLSSFLEVTKISANMLVDGGTSPVYEYQTSNEVLPGVTGGVAAIHGGSNSNASTMVNHHPPQIALAISTRTALSRGLGSKGRFFLPAPVIALTYGWRAKADTVALLNASARDWLSALRWGPPAAGAPPLWPCIVSPGNGLSRPPKLQPILSTRAGDVFDTIRSRRNALVESYDQQLLGARP